MSFELHTHKGSTPASEQLTVKVVDEAGCGGAHHAYTISGMHFSTNPSFTSTFTVDGGYPILFQNGPMGETKVPNGITEQALLAILIHRLECFQNGPFACEENGAALHSLKTADEWLKTRTKNRVARGVEGKNIA